MLLQLKTRLGSHPTNMLLSVLFVSSRQLYRISGGRIVPARDASSGGEYDMIVTADTSFELLHDDESYPRHSLRPHPIAELPGLLAQSRGESAGGFGMSQSHQPPLVDIIAVIVEATPMQGPTQKAESNTCWLKFLPLQLQSAHSALPLYSRCVVLQS